MSIRAADNIERINDLWAIHDTAEECLYFFVDERYYLHDAVESLEMRVGVSYGGNPFTEEMTKNVFLPPPFKPGAFLFGLHCVGVCNGQLTLYSQWEDSRAASPDQLQFNTAQKQAMEILESFSDDDYLRFVAEKTHKPPRLHRSVISSLGDLEVVRGEAF